MRAILAALLMAPWAATAGQQAPEASKGGFKFETTTRLVVVNVSVKTKSGAAVEGLKASDFTVLEDGKPQPIKVFEYQRLEEAVLPERGLRTREAKGTATAAATAARIMPARAGEVKYKDRRLLVLFFDLAGMTVADQMRAQQAASKFLTTQMTKSDLVAVMSYSTSLSVLQDFTDDRDVLVKVVRELPIGETSM